MRNLNDKIPGAPNFQYKEFVKSATALRKGIKNEPNEEQWRALEQLVANVLQPVRTRFGRIRITSGFRSVELCEAVGSSKNSNHARGQAADIEPISEGTRMIDVVEFIYNELDFRTIIMEYFPTGWIHVDYRVGGNVKRLKLKDATHHYENITWDEAKRLYG
ncbi:peptidase M15 [Candidatus Fermentibacteria bacterium]|nr:MAG: peptidase M15 [Candidatus Fermentibacteria bacterium]